VSEHPVDRALALWDSDPGAEDEPLTTWRTVYADPVLVNGTTTPVQDLVDRARMLHRAFSGFGHEILHRVDGPGHSAFAFRLFGEHTGTLVTPLGELGPTNQRLTIAAMDIFTIVDDHVTGVWAIADFVDLLLRAGAVAMLRAGEGT
jgi:predicted ester cyclase